MLRRWRELAVPTALGLFLLLAWDRSVVWLNIKPMMLPRPAAVLDVLLTHTALLREHGWATISDAGLALLLSTVIGIAIAFVLSLGMKVREALMPNLVLVELIPKIALAPLFVIWLGTGMDDIYDQRIPLNTKPIHFKKGLYKFELSHTMREDPLENILSTGIRVEKVK